MKKLLLIVIFLFAGMFVYSQVRVNADIRITNHPSYRHWRPDSYSRTDYYYFPDIDCYYYVPTGQFIYLQGGTWIYSRDLPYRYRYYDLYTGRRQSVDRPYDLDRDNDNWHDNGRHRGEERHHHRH
jgi:hypothetical protein